MPLPFIGPALRLAEVPVAPGADEARRWAQDELAQKVYQDAKPGWAEQLAALIKRAVEDLLNNVGVANGYAGLAIVAGLALVAVIAIVIIVRPRLNRRKAADRDVFAGVLLLTAEQHRTLARTAAQAGDFHTAVSEQFRAIVRSAEERDVSVPAPGRTALEIAAELELAFPSHSLALHHSADLFNSVRYGHLTPTADMYEELVATDTAMAETTPVYAGDFQEVQP